MRRFFVPILLFFLMLSSSYADAAEPIKIGLSLGLTGKYSEMSDMQIKAFKLWERDINSRGGILGRKVNLIIYDDKSEPQTAKSLYEYMITKEKVDLLFAPYSSELIEAIAPATEKYGYPIITTGASADRLWQKGHKYLFGLYTVASRNTVGFLEMLVRYGFENVAIVYADDTFGQSVANGTKYWAEKFGLKVLMFSRVKQGSKDLVAAVNKAKESNVQVLIACGLFNEAVDVRLALKKTGWDPKAFYASVGPALNAYYEKLGRDADYTFSTSQWEPHSKFPGSEAFYESFMKSYGQIPSYQAANAYAAGELLEKAIKKTGSLDRKQIRDMLSAMDAMTIIGSYGVEKTGRQTRHSPLIIQWQHGKKEIVWPEYLSTTKPLFR